MADNEVGQTIIFNKRRLAFSTVGMVLMAMAGYWLSWWAGFFLVWAGIGLLKEPRDDMHVPNRYLHVCRVIIAVSVAMGIVDIVIHWWKVLLR